MVGFFLESFTRAGRALIDGPTSKVSGEKPPKTAQAQMLQKIPIMRKLIWAVSTLKQCMEIDHKFSFNF